MANNPRAGSADPLNRAHNRSQSTSSPSPYPSPSPSLAPSAQAPHTSHPHLSYPRNIPHSSGPPSILSHTGTTDGTLLADYTSTIDDPVDRGSSSGFYGQGERGTYGVGGGVGLGRGSVSGPAARLDLANMNLVNWKKDVVISGVGSGHLADESGTIAAEKARPFNAISQILTHPTRPPDPLRGSRHPLPPLPPNQIQALPKVPEAGFYNTYLESLGMGGSVVVQTAAGGSGKAGKKGEDEMMGPGMGMGGSGAEGVWEMWKKAVEDERRERAKDEIGSLGSGHEPGSPEGGNGRLGQKGSDREDVPVQLPDLSGIPEVYFSTGFNLADPKVWQEVVGAGSSGGVDGALEIRRNGKDRDRHLTSTSRASIESARSHDLLSQHLDHLESHLVHEISLRTPSFFSALSNLQSLTSQTTSCLDRITSLRTRLSTLDDRTSVKGLRIIQRQQALRVKRQVARALEEVESLGNVKRLVGELAEMGDWVGALEGMEEVGRWWLRFSVKGMDGDDMAEPAKAVSEASSRERELHSVQEEDEEEDERPTKVRQTTTSPLDGLPLSQIPALAQVPAELRALGRSIAGQLSSALTTLLTAVLDSRPPSSLAESAEVRLSEEDERSVRADFREQVQPLLSGLGRCDARDAVLDIWRTSVMRSVKEGMRIHLQGETEGDEEAGGEGTAGGASSRAQPLADALRDMSHERFVTLSDQMYRTMLVRIELARALGAELEILLSDNTFNRPSILKELNATSVEAVVSQPATPAVFQEILIAACELANARSAKVLVSRTPQHADLGLEEFATIFEQSWNFISSTEATAGRAIVSLRGVISSQARAFLLKYHAKRLQASAKFVEEELWNQVDVPVSLQKHVGLIVSSAVSDPAGFRLSSKQGLQANGHSNGTNGSAEQPGKSLEVEGQHFFTVLATSKTIEMLEDYLRLVINFEMIATDVMARIVEFLKSFNSRTCQVVLGAGAMRSAGLKNITAKHLALASQSLSIVICLLPYIREFVRRHLSAKQAVMLVEFDKLKRDYQEHQHEIHSKLVAIMCDRLTVHSASVRIIDWESKMAPPRDYATLLVKECTTLHKVLSKYLSDSAVYMIMTQVVDAIRTKIGDEFAKVEFKSDEAKKRMLNDATFIVDKVKDFTDPNMPSPVEGLDDLVRNNPTPKKQVQMGNALNGLLRRGAKGQVTTAEVLFEGSTDSPAELDGSGGASRNSEDRALDDLAMEPPPGPVLPSVDELGRSPGATEAGVAEVSLGTLLSDDAREPAAGATADASLEVPAKAVDEAVVERIIDSVAPDVAQEASHEADIVAKAAVSDLAARDDAGADAQGPAKVDGQVAVVHDDAIHSGRTVSKMKPLLVDLHVKYIQALDTKKSDLAYHLTEHLRVNGVYWGLVALCLMNRQDALDREEMIKYVMSCWDEQVGGFGAHPRHDAHLLGTMSAIQILAIQDSLDILNKDRLVEFILSLIDPLTGSVSGDPWKNEHDTRFLYIAVACLSMLGRLDAIDGFPSTGGHPVDERTWRQLMVGQLERCRNFDGGFGSREGSESHGGQCFVCVAALAILDRLDLVDHPTLSWWLCERQLPSGGMNGRPEKLEDVCYSWWNLSALSVLGKMGWIDRDALMGFILDAQDEDNGGIADRAGDWVDVFHTMFGLAGLSMLGYPGLADLDPIYCMPSSVVERLGLKKEYYNLPRLQTI